MNPHKLYILIVVFLFFSIIVGFIKDGESVTKKRYIEQWKKDDHVLVHDFLIPNVEYMYSTAASGKYDDSFNILKQNLNKDYPKLFENNATDWEGFLNNVIQFFTESKSNYKMIFNIISLSNGLSIPSITLYEKTSTEIVVAPLEELSEFWKIDFDNILPSNTTFEIDFAEKTLINRFDLWLVEKQQEMKLEGITFIEINKIILFVNKTNPLVKKQALLHEFSHMLFHKRIEHISKFEQENMAIFIELSFKGGVSTEVKFTYQEFDELMAKLSELIIVQDENLFEYIYEITINKTPHYQKMRQLIASTSVYKYMAEEHPEKFNQLRSREITNEEINKYLLQMFNEKTTEGKNKLRTYLDFHVENISKYLKEIIFDE